MYRKLWLINGNGDKFDFSNPNNKYFLENINGFGFSKDIDGYTLGNIKKITAAVYDFPKISGDLLFYDETQHGYEDYFNFIKFIAREPLRLFYLPPNTLNAYYCNVHLTETNKSEYTEKHVLKIGLDFEAISRWTTSDEIRIVVGNEPVDSGKYYDLERPYYYAGTTLSNIEVDNISSDAVGMVIEVVGDATNPQWTLTQNGEVYGSCKLLGSYDYIKVNSNDSEQSIYLELDGVAIANPTSYQDLTYTGGVLTFPKIKTGTTIMSFTCGNIDTFDGSFIIRYRGSYISV